MLWYSCQIIDSKIKKFVGITSVLASFTDAFSITASNKTVAVLMENTTSMKEEIQEVIVILFCLKNKQKQKPVINF